MTSGVGLQGQGISAEPPRLHWNFFVDESGKFADLSDEVVVAGVLLRADARGAHPSQLRAAIQAAAPEMPWPLKSSELNRPVLVALAKHVRGSGSDALKTVADEVVERLRQAASRDVESIIGALEAGRRAPYESLLRLETIARNDRKSYQMLRQAADASVAMIGRCIQGLGSLGVADGGNCEKSAPIILTVACGETCLGDGEQDVPFAGDTDTARYLQLLKWSVARAVDVAARQPGRHCVHLHVLERHVFETVPRGQVRTRLKCRHLYPIAREAGRRAAPEVTVKVDEVTAYDDRMHAALVLADFVSNRVRRALGGSPLSLAAVEARIVAELRCPVRTGSPGASHLAAVGFAQDRIERARAGNASQEPPPSGARHWAVEQAAEWVQLVTR